MSKLQDFGFYLNRFLMMPDDLCRHVVAANKDPVTGRSARPLKNAPFCPIPASGSNFNPRNTQCMSVVKIFACLPLKVRDFRIGLAPRLNVKEFNGAGKIEHFSKVSLQHSRLSLNKGYRMSAGNSILQIFHIGAEGLRRRLVCI